MSAKIESLPSGPYLDGLRAVRAHIDVAIRHLERGQSEPDQTLFTDAVFRCNQAFEGSIKEAYRVLAGKNPDKNDRLFDIENFLSSGKHLRPKVLELFTNYRQKWRNPSTHDYTLDFDEDEAIMAILSVSAFAIVLCNQIEGKIAFDAAAAGAGSGVSAAEETMSLLDMVSTKLLSFAASKHPPTFRRRSSEYSRVEGALAGYLSRELASVSDLSVSLNPMLGMMEADAIVQRGDEKIVIELKISRQKQNRKNATASAIATVTRQLHDPSITGAAILIFDPDISEYSIEQLEDNFSKDARLISPS